MLANFVQHDFVIVFVQEVTSTKVLNVRGYDNINIGPELQF